MSAVGDGTEGCQDCGTVSAEHHDECVVALLDKYTEKVSDAARLAGSRRGYLAGAAWQEVGELREVLLRVVLDQGRVR